MKLITWLLLCFFITKAYAFDVDAAKNEIFRELSRDLKLIKQDKPVLILVGGYPGSGKTRLINALSEIYDIEVIAWNAIRQALLDRGLRGSPYDWEIIEAVNKRMLNLCTQDSTHIVIDANAYGKNIEFFENLLEEEGRYTIIKICLNPPKEILLSRVRARKHDESIHQGTEEDLLRDLSSERKQINLNDYSLVIKNDELVSFETELAIVKVFLSSYL